MKSKSNVTGDKLEVTIRDYSYRLLHRGQYNLCDRNSIRHLLMILEKYSGLILKEILKDTPEDNWF